MVSESIAGSSGEGSGTLIQKVQWILFLFLMISIPVTSSPLIAGIVGYSTVSPLAGIPLALLVVAFLIPRLIRSGRLPRVSAWLLLFFAVALVSGMAAIFREIYPGLEQNVPGRVFRALLTLGVGTSFYLVVATFVRSNRDANRALRWIYLGGAVMMVWASIQAYMIIRYGSIPGEVQNIHRIFSIYDTPRNRVAGFAYEPSWLGDQLVILYLPLLLTSVLQGFSAFTNRRTRISVELFLLLWGTAILFLSQSRIGLLSAMAVVGVLVLSAGWTQAGNLAGRIAARRDANREEASPGDPRLLQVALWIVFILVLFLATYSTLSVVSKFDWRIERIFNLDLQEVLANSQYPFFSLAEEVAFAERVVYWENGFRVFSTYPFLGAGLGNTGFFFRENASGYGYHLPEIIFILTAAPEFPNTKSLWVRLLAETGVVGFTVFVTWLFSLAKGGLSLLRGSSPLQRMIGLAGLLSLVAQVFEGFSLDTFALPHLWVMLGLVTAALSFNDLGQS
jgi:hypothetical protein